MIIKYTDFECLPRIDNYIKTIFVMYNDESGIYEIRASNDFDGIPCTVCLVECEDKEEVEAFFHQLYKAIEEKRNEQNIVLDIDLLEDMAFAGIR